MNLEKVAQEIAEKFDSVEFDDEINLRILNQGLNQVSDEEQELLRNRIGELVADKAIQSKNSDQWMSLLVLISE